MKMIKMTPELHKKMLENLAKAYKGFSLKEHVKKLKGIVEDHKPLMELSLMDQLHASSKNFMTRAELKEKGLHYSRREYRELKRRFYEHKRD